jgi:hypothetical protein
MAGAASSWFFDIEPHNSGRKWSPDHQDVSTDAEEKAEPQLICLMIMKAESSSSAAFWCSTGFFQMIRCRLTRVLITLPGSGSAMEPWLLKATTLRTALTALLEYSMRPRWLIYESLDQL